MNPQQQVRIAVLGAGTVGTEVIRLLRTGKDDLSARLGASVVLEGILVREGEEPRDPIVPAELFTTDGFGLVSRADIVVELLGGLEPARSLVLAAIEAGAGVVTANKALLASHGPEIYAAADAAEVDLYFEAAVGGAIPLIRPLRESLAGDRIRRVLGIVNGTTNYILDKMTTDGMDFDTALAQAQELGFAEADPTDDIEGYDAAAKAAILASLAFHTRVSIYDVAREGITGITAQDVASATSTGHVVKLLAIAEETDTGITVGVHPTLVPLAHPLASVAGSFNAVFVEAEAAGELMFYGRGAGGLPTSSAVLGDIVAVARHRVAGGLGPRESTYRSLPLADPGDVVTRNQIRMVVVDRWGVLAEVARVFASQQVSIETVYQVPGRTTDGTAELLVTTHAATVRALAATVSGLTGLDVVDRVESVLRIEGSQ